MHSSACDETRYGGFARGAQIEQDDKKETKNARRRRRCRLLARYPSDISNSGDYKAASP